MKITTIQSRNRASTKEYIIALSNYPNYMKLLNPEFKPYKVIYNWLMEKHIYIAEGDMNVPKVTELAKELNVDPLKVSKHVQAIYEEIIDLNEIQPELFCDQGQKLCFLSFSNMNHPIHFNLGLDVIPREGESFNFQFVKPKNGGHVFYVYCIVHSYDQGEHKIRVFLSSEYPKNSMCLSQEKINSHQQDISILDLSKKTSSSLEGGTG